MNITMTREELRELLGVTEQAMKQICKRNTLEQRLVLVGYSLISKEKVGRNVIYELKAMNVNEWLVVQSKYHIKKDKLEDHSLYSFKRLETSDNMKLPRNKFIKDNELNLSGSTAKRWDDILVDEGAIKKDKIVYLKYILSKGVVTEITKEEYSTFWKHNYEYVYQMGNNERRYEKGLITRDIYDSNKDMYKAALWSRDDCMVVKYTSYIEAENAKRILEAIRNRGTSSKSYTSIRCDTCTPISKN